MMSLAQYLPGDASGAGLSAFSCFLRLFFLAFTAMDTARVLLSIPDSKGEMI